VPGRALAALGRLPVTAPPRRRRLRPGRLAGSFLARSRADPSRGLGFALARFFRRFSPSSLVLVGGDFWPLLLRAVKRRGLPTAVVNGRVSDRSFPRLLRFRHLAWPLFFAPIDAVQRLMKGEGKERAGYGRHCQSPSKP